MSNLYIDRKGIEIRVDSEALAFYDNGERVGTVPMAPLTHVFLRGDVKLSASVLGKLGEHGVGVIVLSGRKGQATLLMGRPHNDAQLRISQYKTSQNQHICVEMARWTVKQKLLAEKALLQHFIEKHAAKRLELSLQLHRFDELLEKKIQLPDGIPSLRAIEGAGAKSFFHALRYVLPESLDFMGRNRRPPKDPVNAVLSLSYTILHNQMVVQLYGAGFDPYIGYFHQLDFGRESLACDLVEPLRPLMTQFTVELFAKQTLTAKHFSRVNGACLLGKAGRQHFYQALSHLQETLFAQINEQISQFKKQLYKISQEDAFTPKQEEDIHERLFDLL